MAFIKKGNRILSEEEDTQEFGNNIKLLSFVIGGGTTGYFSYILLIKYITTKWIYFVLTIILALLGGTIAAIIGYYILIVGVLVLAGYILFIAGKYLWNIM